MKNLNNTLTAKEIRNLNLNENDVLAFDFQWKNGVDNNYLLINGERVISFTNLNDRRKSYNKIQRMGFGLGWLKPQLLDEEKRNHLRKS